MIYQKHYVCMVLYPEARRDILFFGWSIVLRQSSQSKLENLLFEYDAIRRRPMMKLGVSTSMLMKRRKLLDLNSKGENRIIKDYN